MAHLQINKYSKIVTFKATTEQLEKLQLELIKKDLINFDYIVLKFNKYLDKNGNGFSEVKKLKDTSKSGWVLPNQCLIHKR